MAGEDRSVVCRTRDLGPGQRRIVTVKGLSIGVFNVKGRYYALYNRCPHKGAPLCEGIVTSGVQGTVPGEYRLVKEDEIIRCPWHGWEFDITTGRSWFNPHRVRVRRYDVEVERLPDHVDTYPVEVEAEMVVLYLRRRAPAAAAVRQEDSAQ
jgi:nitrite reductase/ring-hydroxylating ferredoxin subunit